MCQLFNRTSSQSLLLLEKEKGDTACESCFGHSRKIDEATTVGSSGKSFADMTRVAKQASTKPVAIKTDMKWSEQLPAFALLPTIQTKTVKTVYTYPNYYSS